ncbi:MAG: family 43 glycosylhydrolase [Oscillospiraceae bacterium]|nr:family 43 glycosylhydrolase [Oscillospiraceae bacterium]
MKKRNRIRAAIAALAMLSTMLPGMAAQSLPAAAKYGTGQEVVEHLNRGISAVNTGKGMLVSWRFNADDPDDAEFRLYRDDALIYTSTKDKPTCYLDMQGGAGSKYRVDTLQNGQVIGSEQCRHTSGKSYFDIPLNSPGSQYSPNDCCVGDVDGDGQYEIFLKWDPNNSQDNSKSGKTDKVFIDCYTLEGKQLWRIDLGVNIRAGQHYTQMCVADFDCDGHAELITRTADGTKDGKGKVIGDGSKDYRNGDGYILSGPEYMTLFDGQTGAALDTINFPVPRGDVNSWGDKYGNRVDRFNSGIAYLDGVHPSAVYNRGYYTRMTISAVDVVNGKLKVRWIFDSNKDNNPNCYSQGNHNLMVGDVDDDGKQEISMGDCVIDDNGKPLWASGKGHGDAQHLGDFLPDRPGLELWECHESGKYGVTLFDAKNGAVIFHKDGDKDTGRCCADNVWAGNKGAEFWGSRPAGIVMDGKGNTIGNKQPAQNFLIYWDGDLERELLDGTWITKMAAKDRIDTIFTADGCASNNSTKSVPCLTADLFGDWREELIMRTSDNKKLRIWCTNAETKVRLTTLMHDVQYRAQVCCEQSSYNQPPHTSYYLSSDAALPQRPNVKVRGAENVQPPTTEPTEAPTEPPTQPANTLPEPQAPDELIYGDVNFDGVVDIFDLALVKKQMLHPIFGRNALRRADVDADGKVTVVDVVALQKYLLTGRYVPAFEKKLTFSYAIDQKIDKGVHEDKNAGFLENAYVNLDNEAGSALEWTVFAQEDGNYLCTFGTANGSTANRSMRIEVNNGEEYWVQDFQTTGDWTTWQERGIVLPLKAGKNTIRMISLTSDGGPNIDYLKTAWTTTAAADANAGDPRPIQLSVSRQTNPFAGNITKQSDSYNYGGDPAAFVDGDTVYAYTGHDISTNAEVDNAIYNIPEYLCYSTKDLVNWKYEGVVMNMRDVSWGDSKSAWASQVIKHNNKYYLYFCSWDKTSEGKQSIGVAVADSPTGPFRDIGHPVVKGTLTNDQSSNWDDIDPTVWVEKDQNGNEHRYLAWGNSRYYICELNDDMTSVRDLNGDGKITFGGDGTNGDVFYRGKGMNMYTEAPWIYRRQREDGTYYGNYYLIYAYGWREQMAYSTCTDLLKGDWTFGGVIFDCNATSNTNHSGLFDFKGKTYMIYHNGALPEGNGYRRSPNIREVNFDSNGRILKMEETTAGIAGTVSTISSMNGDLLGHAAFTNSTVDKDYPYTNVALGFKLSGLTAHDTEWVLVPGLANVEEPTYVSIQSENKTGLFVTVNGSNAVLAQPTTILANDLKRATFRTIQGLTDRSKVTFESVSNPGTYLTCTSSGALTLTDGSDPAACTFQVSAK